ncbi:hypothetical protein E2C01_049067 [Portunus trituberculatus]|uniref:Uncharacterized protein n=1 Tax=Portunus trituberculatus TaxID=210409 RepID=A0A5B7GC69_PORTR|nr:hypothetical protein [Portunus trituberculatus]
MCVCVSEYVGSSPLASPSSAAPNTPQHAPDTSPSSPDPSPGAATQTIGSTLLSAALSKTPKAFCSAP